MMDLVALSGTAVSLAAPYLAKIVDGATEKLGEDAADAAGKLAGWLRAKLTSPAGEEALADLAKRPDDNDAQEALKLQIRKCLRDNAALEAELRALVAAVAATVQQTQTVGASARAVQNAGNNNTITIG